MSGSGSASLVRVACALFVALGAACGGGDLDGIEQSQVSSMDAAAADAGNDASDAAPGDGQVVETMDGRVGSVVGFDPLAPPEPGRLAGITAAHNAVRSGTLAQPPLAPLAWSSEIAAVAQAYALRLAATCGDLVHSEREDRFGWGENLAYYSNADPAALRGTATQAVAGWESERACYTYGPFHSGVGPTCTEACKDSGGCGHYTQLVWRDTTRVGCGVADCVPPGGWPRTYWVCNYDPSGNWRDERPY